MIGIYDVLTWLKRAPAYHEAFNFGYCGKLDNKREKALGVYPLKRGGQPYRTYEGLESYETVGVSLLIHYNRDVEQSQNAANNLYEFLRTPFPAEELTKITDTRRIIMIQLLTNESVFVGTDDNGVYEFVIELILYVEKEIEKNV